MSTNAQAVRELAIYDESFTANVDMTSDQYKIVKLHTVQGQVVLAGAGEGIGVLQNKPEAGQAAQVRLFGQSRIKTKGSSAEPGDRLVSDATGFAVVAGGANALSLGHCLTTLSIEEEVSSILLTGLLRHHA
jgi:hypothetical protein